MPPGRKTPSEVWDPVWSDLVEQQGWRDEVDNGGQRYFLPPGTDGRMDGQHSNDTPCLSCLPACLPAYNNTPCLSCLPVLPALPCPALPAYNNTPCPSVCLFSAFLPVCLPVTGGTLAPSRQTHR